jgi:hypothetical protein
VLLLVLITQLPLVRVARQDHKKLLVVLVVILCLAALLLLAVVEAVLVKNPAHTTMELAVALVVEVMAIELAPQQVLEIRHLLAHLKEIMVELE